MYPPTTKLEIFAKACNVSQIKQLLEKDPDFEINYGAITLTPVQLSIQSFIDASNNGLLWKCDACLNSISAIIGDQRYNVKEAPMRQRTDLVFAIEKEREIKNEELVKQRFEILMYLMLHELSSKPDFDINYSIVNGTPISMPKTALQAAGAYGKFSISTCVLLAKYPVLINNIDQRIDINHYTPLMFTATYGNIETAKKLLFYGADYLQNFTGYPITGIPVLYMAKNGGFHELEKLFEDYKQGIINVTGCHQTNLQTESDTQP